MDFRPILTKEKVNYLEQFEIALKAYQNAMGFGISQKFTNLLIEEFFHIVNRPLLDRGSYTTKTLGESLVHVVYYYNEELRNERRIYVGNKPNVDLYLHWGFNSQYLEDRTSWGHAQESYVIKDIPKDVVTHLEETQVSNYADLADLCRHYKENGVWDESILEYDEEEE